MSLAQAAEESVLYATFLGQYASGIDDIKWGPAYSTGTRVWTRTGSVWRAFLISDLTAPVKPVPVSGFITLSATQTTMSAAFVSTGFGINGITPATTGKMIIIATSNMFNNTANDGFGLQLMYNTTGIPVVGAGIGTDVNLGRQQMPSVSVASERRSMALAGLATGLAIGTPIFPYLAFQAITGGTTSIIGGAGTTNLTAFELALS